MREIIGVFNCVGFGGFVFINKGYNINEKLFMNWKMLLIVINFNGLELGCLFSCLFIWKEKEREYKIK